jgi:hypothetical protein
MYVCSAGMGRDRAGMMYRLVAYELLKQLCLEDDTIRAFQKATIDHPTESALVSACRSLWGIYCFER